MQGERIEGQGGVWDQFTFACESSLAVRADSANTARLISGQKIWTTHSYTLAEIL